LRPEKVSAQGGKEDGEETSMKKKGKGKGGGAPRKKNILSRTFYRTRIQGVSTEKEGLVDAGKRGEKREFYNFYRTRGGVRRI